MADEDEDYFLPVEDQRVFGAGIRRKKIAFVPASSSDPSFSGKTTPQGTSSADRYLSIVLPKKDDERQEKGTLGPETAGNAVGQDKCALERHLPEIPAKTCPVCKQHISSPDDRASMEAHESSIAHQLCLEHSHPPSHLDRENVGLRYLTTYGWDPDSRRGLGAREEGIRIPIKPKEKKNTAGLRETVEDDGRVTKRKVTSQQDEKVVRLNAKQMRIKDMEAKKKAEKLRRFFYGPDLEQYLGPNS